MTTMKRSIDIPHITSTFDIVKANDEEISDEDATFIDVHMGVRVVALLLAQERGSSERQTLAYLVEIGELAGKELEEYGKDKS